MNRVRRGLAALVLCSSALPASAQTPGARDPRPMRLTAKSDRVRELFGQAVVASGNYRLDACLENLRTATREDPEFAAGWALLSYFATEARESAEALARAQALAGHITQSEMLLVRWVNAVRKNDRLAAISNLNDLASHESRDPYVLYLAGRWFVDQRDAARAVPLFEKVLEIDPGFTPVLNRLGYSYAATGDLARAEQLMQRYVAALPGDPNPEDSYGDILFKAGRYDEAKAHFLAALKKDPSFGPSQHELGDVYAMQGNQAAARDAYQKSVRVAANPRRALEYRSSIALSYVRESLYGFADEEYAALIREARAGKYTDLEAGFHETMAVYQADDLAALKHLDLAEAAIRDDHDLAAVTRDEHMATVRRWRGVRSLRAGNPGMADVCIRVMEQRYEATEDEWIGTQLHALRGAWLLDQRKSQEAIAELQQAGDDPFSLELLARARREAGDAAGAEAATRQLLSIHASSIDSVLVVEPARQKSTSAAAR